MMQMMDPKILVPDKAVAIIIVLLSIAIAVRLYAGWLVSRRACDQRMACDPKCTCYLGGFDYGVLYARQGGPRETPQPVREQTQVVKRQQPPED